MNDTSAGPPLQQPLAPVPMRRPTWRFMFSHPAHVIALGFGSGLSPVAPGTVGTLWAWLAFVVLQPVLGDAHWALLIGVGTVVGWWACTLTARHMAVADPGNIVWDEVIAFWLVLWFDAVKPGPVAWADGCFKGRRGAPIGWSQGFGILFDDLVAALCTLLVLALWRWL